MSSVLYSLVSRRVVRIGLAIAGQLVVASSASAQLTSAIDLSSRTTRPTSDAWRNQLSVSPFVRFDHPRLSADARWTLLGGDGQRLDGFGTIGVTYFSPSRAGLAFSAGGFADRTLLNETFALSRLGADARLSYRTGPSGVWLGREFSRDNKPTPGSPVAHFSTGAWRQLRSAVVTVSLSSFGSREGARAGTTRTEVRPSVTGPASPADSQRNFRSVDTVVVVDSGSAGRRHDWRDAQLALHWSAWRLAFQGVVGTRFSTTNQPNETWGNVEAALTLAPEIALIAATGVHPSSAAYGISRSRFVELGFRVAPSALRGPRLPAAVRPTAAAFQITDAEHGTRTLRIRIPDARSVEVSGDFTNWNPVALRRSSGDEWETRLPISPGMHRLAIRVNGESWTTPPGVPSVADEFQGTVGIVVVR